MSVFSATPPVPLPASHDLFAPSKPSAKSFTICTCKTVSKQSTLTPFRINTYEKTGEGVVGSSSLASDTQIGKLRTINCSRLRSSLFYWSLISGLRSLALAQLLRRQLFHHLRRQIMQKHQE